ncbi:MULTISPECIES: YqhV family protein [Sporosarcina]|uniref:YqhV family protein n=1 Tax=Sporosarcina TaxID=1569 RepID=UPI00058D05A2|nr:MULTISPECIES: YqhV family protein [Sporosarcina]WJY28958.1 YqhV family protein [Sporosarcina sp. 0.2-SM1T-5]
MVAVIERALLLMVLLRVLSGSIEITAAALMYKFNDLEKAFYINSMLALVGPVILVTTTGLALSGLTEKISLTRIICLFAGVILIVYSLKAK